VNQIEGKKETAEDVRLVVADVDGALVTPDKAVTPRARAAVRRIIDAGIAFTITSGRPPRGMKMLIDDLHLQHPITAFNGGVFVRSDLSVIRENLLPHEAVQPVIDKAQALHHVLTGLPDPKNYPASGVRLARGTVIWWVDREAAALVREPAA
jgi:hydroxymethylpyrimidine pyrophosphatase-like HAD family hydrolase